MSMYDKNHYNIVISLQLIKKINKNFKKMKKKKNYYTHFKGDRLRQREMK